MGQSHNGCDGGADSGRSRDRCSRTSHPVSGPLDGLVACPARGLGRPFEDHGGSPPSLPGLGIHAWGCPHDRRDHHRRNLPQDLAAAAALSFYAGLAPATRQSGTSIKFERVSQSTNKQLKPMLVLSRRARLSVLIRPAMSARQTPKPSTHRFCSSPPHVPSHHAPVRFTPRRSGAKNGLHLCVGALRL